MTNRKHPAAAALPENKPSTLRKTGVDQMAVKVAAKIEEMSDTGLIGLTVAAAVEYERRHGITLPKVEHVGTMDELVISAYYASQLATSLTLCGDAAAEAGRKHAEYLWRRIGYIINASEHLPISYCWLMNGCTSWDEELERFALLKIRADKVADYLQIRAVIDTSGGFPFWDDDY